MQYSKGLQKIMKNYRMVIPKIYFPEILGKSQHFGKVAKHPGKK